MTLSTIISITISLTFIYLLFSIVTSEIQEIIANILDLRGKNLYQSIIKLLGEQDRNFGLLKSVFHDVLSHKQAQESFPLTNKIYQQYLTPYLNTSSVNTTKSTAISNIQAHKFAHGLISTVKEVLEHEHKIFDHKANHDEELVKAITDIQISPLPEKLKTDLSYLLKKTNSKLTQTEQEINHLELEIQNWFDESMKHAAEIYRRKSKVISFILGMILVLTFNVDTINIVDKLSKSEILIAEFNSLTLKVIESNSDFDSCSQASNDINLQTCIVDIQDRLNLASDNIDNLPVGWNLSDPFKEQFSPVNFPNLFKATIGWLISAIAISMGAPFWFTVLRNFMDFKSSQSQE